MVMLPLLIGFSLVGPQLVTLVLGRDWSATRTLFTATQVACLMLAGWLAIPVFGLDGVAFAELAALAAYPILHRAVVDVYGPSQMLPTYLFGAVGVIALFWHTAGPLAWLPLLCVILSPPFLRLARDELSGLLARRNDGPVNPVTVLAEDHDGGLR